MFLQDLHSRALPPLLPDGLTPAQWPARRKELLTLFCREEYGFSPPAPASVHAQILESQPRKWAGKAEERVVSLGFDTPGGPFSFPVTLALPHAGSPLPLVIYISFEPYPCGKYGPIEEIVDSGYALAVFCYEDVTRDIRSGWECTGLAPLYDRNDGAAWGQISMWAWAASRVMDYAQTLDEVDKSRIYVVGHSRLGKMALWCAAQDERFAGAGVNNSGFGGMAVTRDKQGERMEDVPGSIDRWFCGNFLRYVNRAHEMPFDQHMLAALVAPRLLAVCNAEEDLWADPQSEFMSLYEADKAYRLLGVPGLIAPAEYPPVGAQFTEGRIGYSLRAGTHFLSRHDWAFYLKFFNSHRIYEEKR